jgi:hypothetical protein
LENNGGKPISGILVGDIFKTMGNMGNGWEVGGYMGYITDGNVDSFFGFNQGIITGRSIFQSDFFQTNVIGQVGLIDIYVYGVQPPTVLTRKTGDHLLYETWSYGLSSISYFKLASWYGGSKEYSLHLGVEIGVTWVANRTWYYGQKQAGGKYGNFVGVKVPDVPAFAHQYEYVKFSLAFKM